MGKDRKIKNRFVRLLIQGGIFFVVLELAIALIAEFGGVNIITPTYQMNEYGNFLPIRSHVYGHTHAPNSTYRINKACFSTTYEFNSLGFRDDEFSVQSKKKRVVVLGDSFMEGFGVEREELLSDRLENLSGFEHLNFGVSDKGPTQEFVLYDSIASKFEHDAIIWSVFPLNDFVDDDPNLKTAETIKPCWEGKYPDYQLKFFPKDAPDLPEKSWFKRFFKSYTYTYNGLFYIKQRLTANSGVEKGKISDYFNYTDDQLDRIKYSMERMRESAGNRPISMICIPSAYELEKALSKDQKNVESELSKYANELNIEFFGLFDYFQKKEDIYAFYHSCDSHWNAGGHEQIAKLLFNQSKIYNEKN